MNSEAYVPSCSLWGRELGQQVHVHTVGAVFRVAAIIRVTAVFGALKIIFSDLFILHDNLQVRKNHNQKKKFEKFFVCPFF